MIKTKIDPKLEIDSRYSLSSANILERYNWEKIFRNNHPVEVELGAGDGGFIVELAKQFPERNFVAVERLRGRVRKIIKSAAKAELTNLRALQLESQYVVKHLCQMRSVRVLHIMFPDPWPKKKHHKRRLIDREFIEFALQIMMNDGELRLTTDHQEYFLWAEERFLEAQGWKRKPIWNYQSDPLTDFQKDFLEEGRTFYRGRWQKKVVK